MMVAKSDDEALKRLGIGGGFFSFGIMHYYLTGMHTPAAPGMGAGTRRRSRRIRHWPTVPAVAPSVRPDTVREFLRSYEASGVDEIILLLNRRSHEGTMESIEIMGKEVLPEFIERDAKAVADKVKRLEPVIEKVEGASPTVGGSSVRRDHAFGGLPTGRDKFTAGEIPEAMAEINEGRVKAAQAEKEARGKSD